MKKLLRSASRTTAWDLSAHRTMPVRTACETCANGWRRSADALRWKANPARAHGFHFLFLASLTESIGKLFMPIHVSIVEDDRETRESLAALLAGSPGLH